MILALLLFSEIMASHQGQLSSKGRIRLFKKAYIFGGGGAFLFFLET